MWLMTLKGICEKLGGYLVLAGALLAGLFVIRQSGKSAGRTEARIDQLEADASAREAVRDVDRKIDSMDDHSIVGRAERWVRNNRR